MAGSTAFPFALFRFTSGGDTELSIADAEAIGFDYGVNEASEIGVTGFTIGLPQRRTDVPNVGQRSTTKPATSIVGIPITINFVLNEKIASFPKPLAKLLKWSIEAQDIRGTFSNGRFCVRNDNLDSLPLILAEDIAGIRFVDYSMDDEISWSDHQTGTIFLEYVGTYTSFITNLNTIINAP